jgi:molybdopterin synthase catalytic subunit
MAVRTHVRLSAEALSPDAALRFVADPAAGGTVLFTGTARDHADGRGVAALEYEAFAERAEPGMADLAARAAGRWPELRAVWLEHRTGLLAIGEEAVVVAVSAPHRDEAFAAARWLIDTLKDEVAIWKKEHWADGGSHWPGTPDPVEAAGS